MRGRRSKLSLVEPRQIVKDVLIVGDVSLDVIQVSEGVAVLITATVKKMVSGLAVFAFALAKEERRAVGQRVVELLEGVGRVGHGVGIGR